ncbi:hypothetical protein KP509_11G048500 [Ceratopteris richardii]|uniref:HMA domain-containing protein n=1 Tax=Ceratopteris richardii TaxID=49495 RepID=A0A8T2TU70_CERRI|nr:hypothetical protein KP509_11G048500 [Ceratopteris richardii]
MVQPNKDDEGKIVLETKLCCDKCHYKVYKAITCYPGVEQVSIDFNSSKVTLRACNVNPIELFEALNKKTAGKVTKLLYPTQEPVEVTVTLKMNVNCSACKHKIIKAAYRVKGVCSVNIEQENVVIKGWNLDPDKVRSIVSKCSGKYAEIVIQKNTCARDEAKDSGGNTCCTTNETECGSSSDCIAKRTDCGRVNDCIAGQTDCTRICNCIAKQIDMDHVYHPQYFSDENPNACVII